MLENLKSVEAQAVLKDDIMNTILAHADEKTICLLEALDGQIAEQFPSHPFETGIDKNNFESVISEYLAMSIAFPYIQAGAIYENYKRVNHTSGDTNANLEITSSIASFLVWDEFGGHPLTKKYGDEGLRYLTSVDRNFHSNLLRRDIELLVGKTVEPKQSAVTTKYLDELYDGLSNGSSNHNVAHMVAFEKHASDMIEAMWSAIHRVFGVPKDSKLKYFYEHVGGDSPAEAFHVEMTRKMIGHLVPEQDYEEFLTTCLDAYAASARWCESVISLASCER
jgi:hypothetical protein